RLLAVRGGRGELVGGDALPPGLLRAILRDSRGDLWLGTDEGVRVLRDGVVVEPEECRSLRGSAVKLLVEGPDRSLWIATRRQLLRLDAERRVRRAWTSGHDLPYGEVRVVLPRAGGAWVGSYGGGFYRLDGDGVPAVV